MRKNKSAFTIIELLVVMVVIGILVTATIVVYRGVQERARDDRRRSDIANLVKALELYYSDNGSYPTASGTNSTVNAAWYSSDTTSWSTFKTAMVGTIDSLPTDPRNISGNVTATSSALNYAYYGTTSASYCGVGVGQAYIIVYRLESSPPEKFTDGNCTTGTDLGAGYYTAGASYYRSVKH